MRIVFFCHSLISDWNHGNAHFLRGVTTELVARGHDVRVFEPESAWSLRNLLDDAGSDAIGWFHTAYPRLSPVRVDLASLDLDEALDGTGLVIVHEWSDHDIVRRIGRHRAGGGGYVLLFHDTHHRSVSDEPAMAAYDLEHYDGVLAFGEVVRERYVRRGWARRAWTWHEAADTRVFHPIAESGRDGDLVWIGNWGDGERSAELREFLIDPVERLGLRARVRGVRYPPEALDALGRAGIEYGGWLPNYRAPGLYARFRSTVHVPRRPYVDALPGIPTIRVFEALACGIPLVSAWWDDAEGLFEAQRDFLMVRTGAGMTKALRDVINDEALAASLASHGLAAIRAKHTCAHRVDALLEIAAGVRGTTLERVSTA